MAMTWRQKLSWRLPARESRWRTTSPEDTSMGAVLVAGERGGRAEATNITDVAEELAGGQRAETMQLGQGGAGRADGHLDIIGGLGDPAIELAHLADQIHRQGTQRLGGGVAGSHAAQKLDGMIGAQVAPGTSRNQPGEHDMESVDGLGAGLH
jgi:hypothetical protein